jgi:hypothetical protein
MGRGITRAAALEALYQNLEDLGYDRKKLPTPEY